MGDGLFGALLLFGVALVIMGVILHARLQPEIRRLLVIGLALRVVGSQVYYYLSEWIYGFGDYSTYYGLGLRWGENYMAGISQYMASPYLQDWHGTGFTVRLTGLLLLAIGPSVNGAFLAYALVGYGGIVALAIAFGRSFPDVPMERYLVWIVFFPSLWYWPAALGKDALVLGGLGLAVLGFVGRRKRTGWLALALGLALVFVVRPQVTVVLAVSMFGAYFLESDAKWTTGRILQGVSLLMGGVLTMYLAGGALGLQLFNPNEVGSYLDSRASSSSYGGSAVNPGGGMRGMVFGMVNVLFRPFPWEAGSVASAIAAVEVSVLWGLVLLKRRELTAFFMGHRQSRLMWFGILFIVMYALLTGMALGNLGLIARQRVHIFPFFLMFFAGSRRAARTHTQPATVGPRYAYRDRGLQAALPRNGMRPQPGPLRP